MAFVQQFGHQGQPFSVTVNKNGIHFTASIQIPGRHLSHAESELEADSQESAFRLGQQRGEELIERGPLPVPQGALDEY